MEIALKEDPNPGNSNISPEPKKIRPPPPPGSRWGGLGGLGLIRTPPPLGGFLHGLKSDERMPVSWGYTLVKYPEFHSPRSPPLHLPPLQPPLLHMAPAYPSLKLTYFDDTKGRNELVRLIFAVGQVPYEDELIGLPEYLDRRDGQALPWGQLPVLTIDGRVFGQSCALARYAAKLAGLYPSDALDALTSDAVVDSWRDTLDLYYDTAFDRVVVGGVLSMIPRGPSERHGRLAQFVATHLREQFSRYERFLTPGGGCGAVAAGPTWADLAVYDLVKTMHGALDEAAYGALMADKPALVQLVQQIDALEPVQTHLQTHPYVDMRSYFAPVPFWRRALERVLVPVLRWGFGLYVRVRGLTRRRAAAKSS